MGKLIEGLKYDWNVVQGEAKRPKPNDIEGVNVYFAPIKEAEACFDASFWQDRKVEVLIVFTLAKQADGSNRHLAWKGRLDAMHRMLEHSWKGNEETRNSIKGQTASTVVSMFGTVLAGPVVNMWANSAIPGKALEWIPFDFAKRLVERVVATPANKEKFIKGGKDLIQKLTNQGGTFMTQVAMRAGQAAGGFRSRLAGMQESIAGFEGTAKRELDDHDKARDKAMEAIVNQAPRIAQAAGGK